MSFDGYQTVALSCLVLLFGYFLVKRIPLLNQYNIPEPVAGGFVVALILTLVHYIWGISFQFDATLQRTMMLVFFSSIGLSANFARLIQGGKPLVIFLFAAFGLILLQNALGVSSAMLFGLDPAYGLIAGSMTLTGGHGTGAAWADTLMRNFHIQGGLELAMACATFGLVAGGVIGGPVASYLLKRLHRHKVKEDDNVDDVKEIFEKPEFRRKVNTRSVIETVAMLSVCLWVGQTVEKLTHDTAFQLPTFVWCLFTGVLIRNFLTHAMKFKAAESTIDLLGSVGLSLFLAVALMSLKLWQLTNLALPIFGILALQVILMAAYAIFITYRAMGSDYDAVVLSAGHCGFGLGATPTAVANMQAITDHYGPSHKAFLIVPMVGAFFIDLLNTVALKIFLAIVTFLH
ncbi:sodium/glutamate symporter [Actinobacillus delphinicola]|uniref:Sodium/glutamate symporter n=1 Tax=Actinobacillus delphinicola TaxID=51161 RepID=A0A448TSN5_9PAST|nr:sodium/glutamate symporter [Actinobacillus delphinicola]VEJ09002.1 sodium/glutamate symporter [Actinobacillus delphinicola]